MSYIKFLKVDNLRWKSKWVLRSNTAEVDKRFFESLYPNAAVYLEKSSDQYYHIFIGFKDEADEAEFILREIS